MVVTERIDRSHGEIVRYFQNYIQSDIMLIAKFGDNKNETMRLPNTAQDIGDSEIVPLKYEYVHTVHLL